MVIRNWWVKVSAEGRSTDVELGPRSKDGGISVYVRQRDNGSSVIALKLETRVDGDRLILDVCDSFGNIVHQHVTKR